MVNPEISKLELATTSGAGNTKEKEADMPETAAEWGVGKRSLLYVPGWRTGPCSCARTTEHTAQLAQVSEAASWLVLGLGRLLRGHRTAVPRCQEMLESLPSICGREADSCWREGIKSPPVLQSTSPVSLTGRI